MPPLVLLLAALGCASHVPRFPGPLAWVGRAPEPAADVHLAVDPDETPVPAAPAVSEELILDAPRSRETGEAIARAARHFLSHRPRGFRDDCSGLVSASLHRAGLPITGNTRSLWDGARRARAVHRRKHPHPGDVAFFDDTYDRNRNGRWDDDLTHVAVVLEVDGDGTILLAHGGTSRGRSELRMNLVESRVHVDRDGRVLNDYLRHPAAGDTDRSRYLAGELWRGFATIRAEDLDAWAGS